MILRNAGSYNRRMSGGRLSIGALLLAGAAACGGCGADPFVDLVVEMLVHADQAGNHRPPADPSPGEIARQVADAANQGATSFKAYTTGKPVVVRAI